MLIPEIFPGKQKLKQTYGPLEKQFLRTYQRALRQPGVTGDNLLLLLETRLDNCIIRSGLAATARTGATTKQPR